MVEDKKEDQAQSLRDLKDTQQGHPEEMDVLQLPPRKDVHKPKEKPIKWKFSVIWLRFLFLLFLILVILGFSYPYWDDWFKDSQSEIKDGGKSPLHEEVTIERIEPVILEE